MVPPHEQNSVSFSNKSGRQLKLFQAAKLAMKMGHTHFPHLHIGSGWFGLSHFLFYVHETKCSCSWSLGKPYHSVSAVANISPVKKLCL